MSSTIFAICCQILFYSRSPAALRIAAMDNDAAACTSTKSADGKTTYECSTSKCCAKASQGTSAGQKNLAGCVAEFAKDAEGASFETKASGNNDCIIFKKNKCTKRGACGANIASYIKQGSGAHGDPHVVNMAGEKFDILATGAFSLLSLTRATEEDLLINGTIARFGAKCGESFITDLENTGGWIRKAYNTEALKVRAVQDTAKTEALQVNFGQKWEPLSNLQEMAHLSKAAGAIQLDFSSVTVQVSAGKHWGHGWNFLNLDVQGLANLDASIRVGGLLGYDDHTQVLEADADCAMFAKTAGTDMQDQQSCLSYLKAN